MIDENNKQPIRLNVEPIDPREFERPCSPVRSRFSPDKKPICSGLFIQSPPPPSTPTANPSSSTTPFSTPCHRNRSTNSSSKLTPSRNPSLIGTPTRNPTLVGTPTRNPSLLSSKPTRPNPSQQTSTKARTHINPSPQPPLATIPTPTPTQTLHSPLRASLTAEAIPRKRQILPGAPNPPLNTRLKSLIKSNPSSPFSGPAYPSLSSPAKSPSLNQSQSHFDLPCLLIQSQPQLGGPAFIDEPPIGKDQLENVLVAIRLKGIVDHQLESPKLCWSINPDGTQISELSPSPLSSNHNNTSWNFDSVFGQDATNEDVYKRSGARDLILSAMAGYDTTIFAYGQTASGKTHTLTGSPRQPGIIPLSVQEIFSFIRSHPEREFLLRVSYLEVYNEQIHDLLVPTNQFPPPPVRIRQQTNGLFFADPVREEVVTNTAQVEALIARGEAQRHVAATNWNSRSSRSHTIFGIVIESRLNGFSGGVRRSKVCLIDLAGNERATSELERRNEGAFINKSLLTLEKVISNLAESSGQTKRRSHHIPYRESKLTQILQPSLSGESRVCVICTMNGTIKALEDSRSTLRFASRVKKVQTSAGVNEILSDSALINRYRLQIADLQAQLTDAVNKASHTRENINQYDDSEDTPKSVGFNDEALIKKAEEERSKIKKQLKELQSIILNADNLDQLELLSKETRPVSPVKKNHYPTCSSESDSESEQSDEDGDEHNPHREEKSKRENELEEKIELQAYEIACLRLELTLLKSGSQGNTNSNLNREHEKHQFIDQLVTDNDGEARNDVQEALQRVAESRESLENRLADLAVGMKKYQKFTKKVLSLLDASRIKTRKLELFILKEIDKSTRRLSQIERDTYLNQDQGVNDKSGKGRRRRRSSSLNSNPYELLMSNSSILQESSKHKSNQNEIKSKMHKVLNLSPGLKAYGHQKLGTIAATHQNWDPNRDENGDQEETNEDQEISRLLSIVDEVPELEFIRMSFVEGGLGGRTGFSSNDPC